MCCLCCMAHVKLHSLGLTHCTATLFLSDVCLVLRIQFSVSDYFVFLSRAIKFTWSCLGLGCCDELINWLVLLVCYGKRIEFCQTPLCFWHCHGLQIFWSGIPDFPGFHPLPWSVVALNGFLACRSKQHGALSSFRLLGDFNGCQIQSESLNPASPVVSKTPLQTQGPRRLELFHITVKFACFWHHVINGQRDSTTSVPDCL